jgi:hypothetical protein
MCGAENGKKTKNEGKKLVAMEECPLNPAAEADALMSR